MIHPQDRESMLDELLSQGAPTEDGPRPITDLVRDANAEVLLFYLSECSKTGINPVVSGNPPKIVLHQYLYEKAVAMQGGDTKLHFQTNGRGDMEIMEAQVSNGREGLRDVTKNFIAPLHVPPLINVKGTPPTYQKYRIEYDYEKDPLTEAMDEVVGKQLQGVSYDTSTITTGDTKWTVRTDSNLSADEWYLSEPEYTDTELEDAEQ